MLEQGRHVSTRAIVIFVSGVALGSAYSASCSIPDAKADPPIVASDIAYSNTLSGLSATDVQAALDELAGALRNALASSLTTNPLAEASSWTGEVEALDETGTSMVSFPSVTVTFTPTGPDEGTYEATPANILVKSRVASSDISTTGKYWLRGARLIANAPRTSGGTMGFAWMIEVAPGGRSVRFGDGSVAVHLSRID